MINDFFDFCEGNNAVLDKKSRTIQKYLAKKIRFNLFELQYQQVTTLKELIP